MTMISSFFNSICEPSPLLTSDVLQRKRRTKQNKVILIMHLVIVITLCIHVSLSPKPSLGQFLFVGSHTLNLVIFALFCRSFPFFYKAFYVLTTLVIGPLALSLDPDGIFGCWIGINIYPIFMMYYCESQLVGIFVLLSQLFYLSKVYKPFMTEVLFSSDPEFYATRLTGITAYTTIFNVIVVYIIGFSLQKSYMQELDESEQKKMELERQKVFLLSFSSELRNIIHAVAGSIQLSLLEQISPIVKGHLENAEAGTNLLLSMINNILDTGNMHVGELEINPTVTTIQSALEKMWNVCLYLLKAKNLTGYLKITKDIPHLLKIDEYRLMQIMLNMMNNAVHNTQKGSVNISLHWIPNANSVREEQFKPYPFDDTDEGLFEKEQSFALLDNNTIFVGSDKRKWVFGENNQNRNREKHGILKIIITDTGEGINESDLGNLFQGEGSNKPPGGNSLSLFITKQICQKMGGEIKVFSKVNKGTSFIICLPAEPVLMEKNEEIMSIRNFDDLNRWFKFKVIIADDMSFNIKILTNYFNKLGIDSIIPANDGKEAYQKYLQQVSDGCQHQIICLDVDMPILNGKEVLKKIREYEAKHSLNPSLIVMVSGNCAESEIKECLSKPGADYFLKKPATFNDLSNVLMKHFSIKFSSMFSNNNNNDS